VQVLLLAPHPPQTQRQLTLLEQQALEQQVLMQQAALHAAVYLWS